MKQTTRRRAAAVAVALLLVGSTAACRFGRQATAYTLVGNAVSKTGTLDSAAATLALNSRITVDGVTTEVPLTCEITTAGRQGDNPVSSLELTLPMAGMSAEMKAYQEGDCLYITLFGQHLKTDAAQLKKTGMISAEALLPSFSQAMLADAAVQTNQDGSRTVAWAPDGAAFSEVYAELQNTVLTTVAGSNTAENTTVRDVQIEITVSESGYVSDSHVSFSLDTTLTNNGVSAAASADVDAMLVYHNPGTAVTVQPPEGYADFPALDLASLLF